MWDLINDYLLGVLVTKRTNIFSMVNELARISEREREREYIWESVKEGDPFLYDLRADSLDEEEWVFVRLKGDDTDLEPGEISWEEFVKLEPSFEPLGIWYESYHRNGESDGSEQQLE